MTVTTSPLAAIEDAGVLAVIRAPSLTAAQRTVAALVAGGVTGIEITYSTPDAATAIARLSDEWGSRILLGAGTVLTAVQVTEAVDAGAAFLVSPGHAPALTADLVATGLPALVGALTPSEVMAAVAAGATAVKIFPASLGGVAHLKALRGPFPDVPLMPTGGVTAANLGTWMHAGAIAVGAGSDLCSPKAMADGDWATITDAAAAYSASLRAVRSAP